jgi:hypothetical protein
VTVKKNDEMHAAPRVVFRPPASFSENDGGAGKGGKGGPAGANLFVFHLPAEWGEEAVSSVCKGLAQRLLNWKRLRAPG